MSEKVLKNKKAEKGSKDSSKSVELEHKSIEDFIKKSKELVAELSYEQCLHELDLILDQIQGSNILVNELQRSYIKGKIYLEHCEKLLDKVEQDVILVDESSIGKKEDSI